MKLKKTYFTSAATDIEVFTNRRQFQGLGQLTPQCDNGDIYGDTKIFKPLMTKTYKNSISWKEND